MRVKNDFKEQKEEKSFNLTELKKEYRRRIYFLCLVIIAGTLACIAYFSSAWFANNRTVGAESASITADATTPNLFIRLASDSSKEYYSFISKDWGTDTDVPGLYPISTADCGFWFYLSKWERSLSTNGTITTGKYGPSEYTRAAVTGTALIQD